MTGANKQNDEELLRQCIAVYNRALDQNRDRFPFKQVLGAAQLIGQNRDIRIDFAEGQQSSYAMIFDGKNLSLHEQAPAEHFNISWQVERSYLEEMLSHPQSYIDNPANLDWDWLYVKPEEPYCKAS